MNIERKGGASDRRTGLGSDRGQDEMSKGDELRAAFMHQGEKFLGNWDVGSDDSTFEIYTAWDEVSRLRETNKYDSVRLIPAFHSDGHELLTSRGIVVMPKSQRVDKLPGELPPRPTR